MRQVYAPGCAFKMYKPELSERVLRFLDEQMGGVPEHLVCCQHEPGLMSGTRVINTCAGCDRRYRSLYDGITTVSLWEVLAESDTFPFPDYKGAEMSLHDACPTRTEERVHKAVRRLLEKMNIKVVEPQHTGTDQRCCGDSFYPSLPAEQIKEKMRERAAEMPREDVVVYCISCIKSMHIGGKKPRYIVDLLFGEDTVVGTFEPEEWHGELQKFIDQH